MPQNLVKNWLNILFVTQNYSYPGVPHGGGQDFWRLFDALRHHHKLYVITFDDPVVPVPVDALAPFVEKLHVIRYARTLPEKALAAGRAVLHGYRGEYGGRRAWEMQRLVQRWCEQDEIDVLHCGWTETGGCLGVAPDSTVRILDAVEVRFLVDERAITRGEMSLHIAARRKAEELAYCRAADLVITRSEADLQALGTHIAGLNGFVLPPAGNVDQLLTITPDESLPNQLLFCGAMNRSPNIEGITWFLEQVWPRLQQMKPELHLTIAGAHPTAQVKTFGNLPGVCVTGYVSNLRELYARTKVIIAPIFVSGGSQNKVIDGLAAGRPIVATSIASRGVGAPCIQIADQAAEFAAAINHLLSDSVTWEQMAAASRFYAQSHFDWKGRVRALEAQYWKLFERKAMNTSGNSRRHDS